MKFQMLLLNICIILILFESCKKDKTCPTIECNSGTFNNETCGCDCPTGYLGTNCEIENLCLTQGIVCENGGICVNGECNCTDGFIGIYCESFDPAKVQVLLDSGHTPFSLFTGNVSLDSLYGKMYEGGLIFYLDTTDGRGLVAATEDQSEGAEWGCFGLSTFATSETIGTGVINSSDILAVCMEAGIAAKLCEDLYMNGQTDWFLPSKDELYLMWTNLADSDGDGQNIGPGYPGNLGGFQSTFYWSSTEEDNNTAWMRAFSTDFQNDVSKTGLWHVRAVRAF